MIELWNASILLYLTLLRRTELWNPGVERVDLLQEEDEGVGKARVCNFYNVPDGGVSWEKNTGKNSLLVVQ